MTNERKNEPEILLHFLARERRSVPQRTLLHYQHEWMSTPSGAKPLLPASSFDFLRWLLLSFWDAKKKKYSLQVDMQYAFDALVAVTAGTQGWPATAAGVERIASKAGTIVTALRNRYKTGSVEKLVFILSNKEFTPKVE